MALQSLEEEVQLERSKQGILGQMAAQKRLNDRKKRLEREQEEEIEYQLRENCKYDSAVRAININTKQKSTWSESKNAYQVISLMSDAQRKRYKEMTCQRLKF